MDGQRCSAHCWTQCLQQNISGFAYYHHCIQTDFEVPLLFYSGPGGETIIKKPSLNLIYKLSAKLCVCGTVPFDHVIRELSELPDVVCKFSIWSEQVNIYSCGLWLHATKEEKTFEEICHSSNQDSVFLCIPVFLILYMNPGFSTYLPVTRLFHQSQWYNPLSAQCFMLLESVSSALFSLCLPNTPHCMSNTVLFHPPPGLIHHQKCFGRERNAWLIWLTYSDCVYFAIFPRLPCLDHRRVSHVVKWFQFVLFWKLARFSMQSWLDLL